VKYIEVFVLVSCGCMASEPVDRKGAQMYVSAFWVGLANELLPARNFPLVSCRHASGWVQKRQSPAAPRRNDGALCCRQEATPTIRRPSSCLLLGATQSTKESDAAGVFGHSAAGITRAFSGFPTPGGIHTSLALAPAFCASLRKADRFCGPKVSKGPPAVDLTSMKTSSTHPSMSRAAARSTAHRLSAVRRPVLT
jgi:hypothetical protein